MIEPRGTQQKHDFQRLSLCYSLYFTDNAKENLGILYFLVNEWWCRKSFQFFPHETVPTLLPRSWHNELLFLS